VAGLPIKSAALIINRVRKLILIVACKDTPVGPFGLPGLSGPPDQIGEWSAVNFWPTSATHSAVLPTGKVLWWRTGEPTQARLYDPVSNSHSLTPLVANNLFCAGHSSLADGSTLVVGGTLDFSIISARSKQIGIIQSLERGIPQGF